MKPFIIGVDGGGTKTNAILYSARGDILATAQTGPSNVNSDLDGAVSSIAQALENVLSEFCNHKVDINIEDVLADCILSIGCAGAEVGENKEKICKHFEAYSKCLVNSDLAIACMAANKGEDCGLVITGTGSSLARFKSGELTQFGGHGFVMGDHASGAWLGKQLLTEYLLYLDGISEGDPLFLWLEEEIGKDKSNIVNQYANASPAKFAALGSEVFTYVMDSALAGEFVEEAFMYLSSQIEQNLPGMPLFITGGLADFYHPLLKRYNIQKVQVDACYGAFLLAQHSH